MPHAYGESTKPDCVIARWMFLLPKAWFFALQHRSANARARKT